MIFAEIDEKLPPQHGRLRAAGAFCAKSDLADPVGMGVASVIRNALIDPGNALANKASTVSENAISVAVGIAHPCDAAPNGTTAPVAMVILPAAGGANC